MSMSMGYFCPKYMVSASWSRVQGFPSCTRAHSGAAEETDVAAVVAVLRCSGTAMRASEERSSVRLMSSRGWANVVDGSRHKTVCRYFLRPFFLTLNVTLAPSTLDACHYAIPCILH